jgi:putative ABC transport system permease protein
MTWLKLAGLSLLSRKWTNLLTIFSISMSVMLLLNVEKAQEVAEDGFTQAISNTDLIVGARSGPIQLILYTVFNIGNATHNLGYDTYQKIASHPEVEWTIPISLGDGHRGYRVVGTEAVFFQHYSYRRGQKLSFSEGSEFQNLWDVVIGAEVAEKLGYQLGQKVVIAHGVTRGEGILKHDDKPFQVKGILKRTGTPVDQALYVSLKGIEALHIDWQTGAMPTKETAISADQIQEADLQTKTITAFYLRTKSRIGTLRLQREINEYSDEALLAIIPGATLSELWRTLGYVENILRVISWMVVCVSLLTLLISLLTSLNERMREMAIYRSLGASPGQLSFLLVLESALVTVFGICFGVVFSMILAAVISPWLSSEFGLQIPVTPWVGEGLFYLSLMLGFGVIVGLVPAWRVQALALKKGLQN